MPIPPDALATEFDMLMHRAGLSVSPDVRAEVLPAYQELRDQLELLRGPRTAAAEPSNIFRVKGA